MPSQKSMVHMWFSLQLFQQQKQIQFIYLASLSLSSFIFPTLSSKVFTFYKNVCCLFLCLQQFDLQVYLSLFLLWTYSCLPEFVLFLIFLIWAKLFLKSNHHAFLALTFNHTGILLDIFSCILFFGGGHTFKSEIFMIFLKNTLHPVWRNLTCMTITTSPIIGW